MSERKRAHLAGLLEEYQPTEPAEQAFAARMEALLQSDGEPFSREHFAPGHFTASAFILSPDDDALLLVFHGKLHRWLQPGGHVDPDDVDIIGAAAREVQEEVGLCALGLAHEGIFDIDIHDIPPLKGEPAHAHFDVRFLFRANDLSFTAGSDAKDARWWSLPDIDEARSDRSVTRAVQKLLG